MDKTRKMQALQMLFRERRFFVISLLILSTLLTGVILAHAAYQVQVPITDGETRWQNHYGNNNGAYLDSGGHKGVDYWEDFGTPVLAVADGKVVDLFETCDNGTDCNGAKGFGNYVLIRHNQQHYVSQNDGETVDKWGYVYSIYAHLAKLSVEFHVGDFVDAGQKIAEVGNTGNSDVNHLHFQIVLDESDTQNQGDNYPWTEYSSRNPEVWLAPRNNDTARAVGLLADGNGNPIGGMIITGMEKSFGDYESSETYDDPSENPDDILVENFATTDVTPGTYDLSAEYPNGGEYRDLGQHTFTAGQTTYIGLHPISLPRVYSYTSYWDSTIVIHNNDPDNTAQVTITYFRTTGTVWKQQTRTISSLNVSRVNPTLSGFTGSALVVSSTDISVVVENKNGSQSFAYNGVAAVDDDNLGWGEVGTTLYAPVIMHYYYNWHTNLTLFNPNPEEAEVTIYYYDDSGEDPSESDFTIPAYGSVNKPHSAGKYNELYAARITSSQPLAGTVYQFNNDNVYEAYNLFSSGSTTAYVPLIMNKYWKWNTSINVQNTSNAIATVTIRYYNASGSLKKTFSEDIPPYESRSYYSPNEGLPFTIGSAKVTSTRAVAVVVNQSRDTSPNRGLSYNGVQSGSAEIVIPDLLNYDGPSEDWVSSVNVRNVGTSGTYVTLTFEEQFQRVWIRKNGFYSFYVPGGWGTTSLRGPATVTTSNGQPIAVIVNHSHQDDVTDQAWSFNATNR